MDEHEPVDIVIPNPLTLTRVREVDWYDGPVTGLVWEESTGPWLSFLLSVQRPRLRTFGLTRTTAERSASIEALLSEHPATTESGHQIQGRFHIALAESKGPLVLLRGQTLAPGEPLEQTQVAWEVYRSRVTFSADDAFDASRGEQWTTIFDEALEYDRVRDRFRRWCADRDFGFRDMGFPDGCMMLMLPGDEPTEPGAIRVVEAWVGVETDGVSWQLRVAEHGGRHWLRDVSTEAEARRVAESYLRNPTRPPGEGWRESNAYSSRRDP